MRVCDSAVQSICFNCHNGWTQLCVGCNNGSVHLIDVADMEKPEGTPLTKPGMNTSEITQSAFSPPLTASVAWNPKVSHIVCTSTASGHVIVWDIRQKAMWCELFDNNTSRVASVAWHPQDGLQLLTGARRSPL